MEAERAKKKCKSESNALASALTKMWGLGLLSARNLQFLASCALQDGLENKAIEQLAALGTFGSHPANCHRDMIRGVCKTMNLEASLVTVPALDSKTDPPQITISTPWLPPHLLVAELARNYPQHMEAIFGFSKAKRFWLEIKPDDPRLFGSPIKEALEEGSLVVPLHFHGDGVEYSSTDSMLCFSWGSILGNNGLKQSQQDHLEESLSAFDKCFLMACYPKAATTEATWNEFAKAMTWSLKAMWEGVFPEVDHAGKRVTGKWSKFCGNTIMPERKVRFILWTYLGDLEYLANHLKYPHWNKDSFCSWCNSSKTFGDRFVYDFSERPGWSMHSLEYQLAHPASNHPLVTQVPGCAAAFRIQYDGLHTIELGLVARLAGSTLHALCYCGGFPEEPATADPRKAQAILDEFWCLLKQAYKHLSIEERLNNLKLAMFSNPKRDKAFHGPFVLKGHAGELKHMVPAMALALQRLSQQHVEPLQWLLHAAAAFLQLSQYYAALDAGDLHLTEEQADQVFKAIKASLQHYSWLHTSFPHHREKCVYFQLFPKLHFCHHIGWFAKWQNPRTTWCYASESWIGSLAIMAHSCSHGTRAARLCLSLADKYLCALHLRLTHAS